MLKSKLSSLLSAVIDVKREMNSLKPVSSIPQELLVEIFYQLGQSTSRTRKSGSYEWTVVSWVCHYWRETALQHSILWDHLIFKVENSYFLEHALKEVLNRSGQAPLIVRMEGTPDARKVKHVRAVRAVLEHISHIQSLSLTIPGWIHEKGSTLGIAHLLEELDIRMKTTPNFSPEDPGLFPGCQFPALQRVVATSVPYFIIHPLLSSQMTELELAWCNLNESESLLFIDILNTLHNLHDLSLMCVRWVHSGAGLITQATLPRLRRLHVFCETKPSSQAQILNHLIIPADTTLKMRFLENTMNPSLNAVLAFIEGTANLVRKSSIGKINPLFTAKFGHMSCGVSAWSQPIEIEDIPLSNYIEITPQVEVKISADVEQGRRYAWVVRALGLTEVQVVTMDGISIYDISAWHEVFSMLTNLRVLRVSGTDRVFSDVYRLWTAGTLDTSTTDAGIDVFPSLKKLELICCSSISGEEELLALLETKRYEVSPIAMRVQSENSRLQTWEGFRAVRVV